MFIHSFVVGKPWWVDYRVQQSSAAQGWQCMIITPWKCNQSSYVSCLPVYNSYYRERTGKNQDWARSVTLGIWRRLRNSTALGNRLVWLDHGFNLHRNIPLSCEVFRSHTVWIDLTCQLYCHLSIFREKGLECKWILNVASDLYLRGFHSAP